MISKMQRKYLFLILLFIVQIVYSCSYKNDKKSGDDHFKNNITGTSDVKFDTLYHDFGTLVQGEKVSYIFNYKNTGQSGLIIKDAYSTCGCAVANYTKQPVPTGEKGTIEIVFDSTGKQGVQYKNIMLKMNTSQEKHTLSIKANVIKK
ncbi:MAG: DUF1573 domain-containing protein [Bacteroidales bacterium]